MKRTWGLWLVLIWGVAGSVGGSQRGKEDYLAYAIPPDARAFESNPRPGSEYELIVSYTVGDVKVGIRRYWDREKTRRHSEELFRGGQQHGVQREWYPNGQLKLEAVFKDGQRHGTFKQWGPDGKLLGSFVMEAGSGTFQTWHPNGQTHEIRPYKGGKLQGECRTYFDSGKVFQVITYKEGKPHGISSIWDRAGKLVEGSPLFYVRGQRVTQEAYRKARETDPSLPPIPAGVN